MYQFLRAAKYEYYYYLLNDGNELILVNIGDYQSAQTLSEEAIKIFEENLKPPAQDENHNTNRSIAFISKSRKWSCRTE